MSEYVSDPVSSEEEVVAVEEPAPVEEPVAVAVEEVSTETVDNSNQNELEERVKVLEERLEKLIDVLHTSKKLWEYFNLDSEYDNLPR